MTWSRSFRRSIYVTCYNGERISRIRGLFTPRRAGMTTAPPSKERNLLAVIGDEVSYSRILDLYSALMGVARFLLFFLDVANFEHHELLPIQYAFHSMIGCLCHRAR